MNVDLNSLKKYDKIYLGFSGGADSTALAHFLVKAKVDFSAVHFHHHIREESADADAEFCRKFCHYYKIPFQKIDLDMSQAPKRQSVESAARNLRQQWWQQNIDSNSVVLLAHHKDDQRENFLLRALRGSSSSGLTGFKETATINEVTYHRPLFNNTRESIIKYLNKVKIVWREDESNEDIKYQRNRIRHNILPELAKAGNLEGLDRTLTNTAMDADFLEVEAQKWLSQNDLTTTNFLAVHDALKARIIRYFILGNLDVDYYPGHDTIQRIAQECRRKHEECISVNLAQNLSLRISSEGDIFLPPDPFEFTWHWQKSSSITIPGFKVTIDTESTAYNKSGEIFLLSALESKLTIRTWLPGDSMVPFGRKTPQKIKKIFNAQKMSAQQKMEAPLILNEDKIIYIPGVKRAHWGLANKNDQIAIINYERI